LESFVKNLEASVQDWLWFFLKDMVSAIKQKLSLIDIVLHLTLNFIEDIGTSMFLLSK